MRADEQNLSFLNSHVFCTIPACHAGTYPRVTHIYWKTLNKIESQKAAVARCIAKNGLLNETRPILVTNSCQCEHKTGRKLTQVILNERTLRAISITIFYTATTTNNNNDTPLSRTVAGK